MYTYILDVCVCLCGELVKHDTYIHTCVDTYIHTCVYTYACRRGHDSGSELV